MIEVINVLKLFTIRHNQADSLKSKFIGIVHKRYREQRKILWALRHVGFDVFPGEAFGLSGKNGSGNIHGMNRKEVEKIYAAFVEFSDLDGFMDDPGMHARLGFALAVNLNPDVLLVDEVLAVGDEAFQEKCIRQIQKFRAEGKTIIFVSHAAETVKTICDRACVLDRRRGFRRDVGQALETYPRLLVA